MTFHKLDSFINMQFSKRKKKNFDTSPIFRKLLNWTLNFLHRLKLTGVSQNTWRTFKVISLKMAYIDNCVCTVQFVIHHVEIKEDEKKGRGTLWV